MRVYVVFKDIGWTGKRFSAIFKNREDAERDIKVLGCEYIIEEHEVSGS